MTVALVCGGRDFTDRRKLFRVLDMMLRDGTAIVHGDAKGADRMAGAYARQNGLPEIKVPANWEVYPRSAGPVRNSWMLAFVKVDLCIAFPGGTGTADMVRKARNAKIKVIEVNDDWLAFV